MTKKIKSYFYRITGKKYFKISIKGNKSVLRAMLKKKLDLKTTKDIEIVSETDAKLKGIQFIYCDKYYLKSLVKI